jgi:hypothetical protein
MIKKGDLKFSTHGPIDEETVLNMIENDWGYRRNRRNTKETVTFKDSTNLQYFFARITKVIIDGKERPDLVGKVIGYCGTGEYQDLVVDGGAYTLSGTSLTASDDIPNFRKLGVYPTLAKLRNGLAKSMATNRPFLITLNTGITRSNFYDNEPTFYKNHRGLPSWTLDRLDDTGKTWYVYQPIEKLEKWFNTLRR